MVNQEEKEARDLLVRNSTQLGVLLLGILERKYNAIERRGFREEDYASGGWENLQAFRNGKLAALDEIADLFNHLKDN